MRSPPSPRAPLAVWIAAFAMLLLTARQFAIQALPAIRFGAPTASVPVLDVGLTLLVAWGLLRVRRWAWWAAVALSWTSVAAALLLALVRGLDPVAWAAGADPLTGAILWVGGLSLATLVCLLAPAGRRPFRRAVGTPSGDAGAPPADPAGGPPPPAGDAQPPGERAAVDGGTAAPEA